MSHLKHLALAHTVASSLFTMAFYIPAYITIHNITVDVFAKMYIF